MTGDPEIVQPSARHPSWAPTAPIAPNSVSSHLSGQSGGKKPVGQEPEKSDQRIGRGWDEKTA